MADHNDRTAGVVDAEGADRAQEHLSQWTAAMGPDHQQISVACGIDEYPSCVAFHQGAIDGDPAGLDTVEALSEALLSRGCPSSRGS